VDADDDEKLLEESLAAAQRRGLLQCKCPLMTKTDMPITRRNVCPRGIGQLCLC
jgi:hypothetical protein